MPEEKPHEVPTSVKRIEIPRIRRHADIDEELEEGIESDSEEQQTENYSSPFDDQRKRNSLHENNIHNSRYKSQRLVIPSLPMHDEDDEDSLDEEDDYSDEEEDAEIMDAAAFSQLPPHVQRMLAEGQIPDLRLANLTNEERAVLMRQMFFERDLVHEESRAMRDDEYVDDLDENDRGLGMGKENNNDGDRSDDDDDDDDDDHGSSASDVEDMQTY